MDFISHDKKTITEMLKIINVPEVDDLFQDIPKDLIIESLNISDGLSEPDVLDKMREYGEKNKIYSH